MAVKPNRFVVLAPRARTTLPLTLRPGYAARVVTTDDLAHGSDAPAGMHVIHTIAIIGAGNGGKAAAADLALQGQRVRLFEFPEYRRNVESLARTRRIKATGAVQGEARIDVVTHDLAEAVAGADAIMVCTQALAHERVARVLAPCVRPGQLVVMNPGSTGGTLRAARVFREAGMTQRPVLVEFSTLTYGCRAEADTVHVAVRVGRVMYGTLPGSAIERVGPELERLFPGLVRAASVLEAGLNNANPVIHPPIVLLNAARFETQATGLRFYRDGVSPTVARLIEALDTERMALLRALGYAAQPDPVTCVAQGYATSTEYLACYADGPGFAEFAAPDTLDHRYVHEDIGVGLVLYCHLGQLLGVPTSCARGFVELGSAMTGIDYFARGSQALQGLGLDGLGVAELKSYLDTGIPPGARTPWAKG